MNGRTRHDFGLRWPVEVDLHLHTTASDGLLSPTELIERVAETGLKVVAIADHDSTDGLDEALEAARRHPHLMLIPAVELGTEEGDTEMHLLGYFIDRKNVALGAGLARLRETRKTAVHGTVKKLAELGMPVSWERVQELAGGAVGRPHVARAMVERGYIDNVHEAFDRYLGDDGIARVPREKLSPLDGLKLVHAAGGVGVIAHPRTVKNLRAAVTSLVDAGLAGIEVYAERYMVAQRREYEVLADRYDLIHSGGTDYHGFGTEGEVGLGELGPARDAPSLLFKRARSMHGDRVGWVPDGPL